MVHVWMVKTDRVLSEEEAAALTACLPPERRVRLAGQLPRQQAEVLWAYGLLLALLRERCGWREIPSMDRTDSGKPFFPGHPQVHFSISHTEGAAAAAVADAPVGVDIQRIQTPPRHLARLTGLEEPEPFFESWVRWEARAKRSGTGILDMVRHRPPLAPGEVCTAIAAFPGYAAAAAGAETVLPEQVRWLTGADLLGRLDIWA